MTFDQIYPIFTGSIVYGPLYLHFLYVIKKWNNKKKKKKKNTKFDFIVYRILHNKF